MHEVNTGAAGLRPARWLRAWVVRSRTPASRNPISPQPESSRHMRTVSWLTVALAVIVVAVTVSGLAIGYRSGQRSDEQLSLQQHAALTGARKLTVDGSTLTIERQTEEGYEVVTGSTPAKTIDPPLDSASVVEPPLSECPAMRSQSLR